mmetsp:Transcript_59580/g.50470  ORF Transcript_59580/g.50470 Transcript_59580/m.50470 type:complete len:257 (+) Transcript_59580:3-773(+)
MVGRQWKGYVYVAATVTLSVCMASASPSVASSDRSCRHGQRLEHNVNVRAGQVSGCVASLRLRGGDDAEDDEFKTPSEKLDRVMKATLGNTVWSMVKALIGWHEKPKRSPSQDLKELQDEAEARKKRGAITDRKLWYFLSMGPIYALNPLTHVSRLIAGTEKTVRSALLVVNAERDNMSFADIRAKLMAPKSKGGMGLTSSRVSEVFYRASIDVSKEDMDAPVKELAFADEDDAELEAFKQKALANAAKKRGGKRR